MNAGVLPANNMYDMPADIMLVLLAIQGDVDAAVVEALALFLRLVEHDAGFTQHGTPQPTSFQSKVPFWGEQLPPNVPAGNETSLSIEVPFGAVPQLAPRLYSDVCWVMVTDAVSLLRFPEHVALVMAVADAIDASHQR